MDKWPNFHFSLTEDKLGYFHFQVMVRRLLVVGWRSWIVAHTEASSLPQSAGASLLEETFRENDSQSQNISSETDYFLLFSLKSYEFLCASLVHLKE